MTSAEEKKKHNEYMKKYLQTNPAYQSYRKQYMEKYSKENSVHCVEKSVRWQKENKERYNSRLRTWRQKTKADIFKMFGAYCSCCGDSTYEFLCLDHINGGGSKHRRETGGFGSTYWTSILKDPDAKSKYRVLCHNCNMSRGIYGYCPHEEEKEYGIGVAC